MRNSFNQPLVGHEYGLHHCKNARLFRPFRAGDERRAGVWGQMGTIHDRSNPMQPRITDVVYSFSALHETQAVEDGHTDEYVGYVHGLLGGIAENDNSNKPMLFSAHMFGRGAGGVVATLGTGLSLRQAMRTVEAAWMLGLVAEQLGGGKR